MLSTVMAALYEKWIDDDLSPETRVEYEKVTSLLKEKGLNEKEINTIQEQVINFCVVAQEDAFKSGFKICMDLLNGMLK